MIAPLADGENARSDCLPASASVESVLKSVGKGLGDSIWLRCGVKNPA